MITIRFLLHRLFILAIGVVVVACGSLPADPATVEPLPVATPAIPNASPTQIPLPVATEPPAATPTVLPPTSLPEPTIEPTATSEPTVAPTAVAPTNTPRPPNEGTASLNAELLFLRGGSLYAMAPADGRERLVVADVLDFSPSSDGRSIALVRGAVDATDIWIVNRDGSNLIQITNNDRVEASISWATDGQAIVYASAPNGMPYAAAWPAWSRWCGASEVRLLNLADRTSLILGAGCDPAFSPDGRRIAFATAPTVADERFGVRAPLMINAIRLVNRQGQNGWDFARAIGEAAEGADAGQLVYAPAWSPDGTRLTYHRYLGMQIEVDVNLSEIGGSFEGRGQPFGEGAGWLKPARFAPNSRALAVVEYNFSDARGFGGYDEWSIAVIQLDGSREVAMPAGPVVMLGSRIGDEDLARAQSLAWSPDGMSAVVLLPPDWQPGLSRFEPLGIDEVAGEIWLWRPGNQPEQRLVMGVDFASPLAWVPALNQ